MDNCEIHPYGEYELLCTTHNQTALQCSNDRVTALELKITAMTNALNKIHDLAGQMSGPDAHPNLGAIQALVHEVTGDCGEKRNGVIVGKNSEGETCCARCGAKDYPLEHHKCRCGATIPFGRSGGVSLCKNLRPCAEHPRASDDEYGICKRVGGKP